jgi:tetrahydromethanopterin S-methyltransferase subunit F
MTKIEAHKFIERWDRNVFLWRAKTEATAALRIQRFAMGFMFAMFLWILTAVRQMRHSDFYFGLTIGILALVMFGFSFWLYAHLREAGRALGYLQTGNLKS